MGIGSVQVLAAGLLAAGLVLQADAAQAGTTCLYNGVCADTHTEGTQLYVTFHGQPRVAGDYVTNFYQVRGGFGGEQVECCRWPGVAVAWGADIGVQACRRLGAVIRHTRCTSWAGFRAFSTPRAN